MVYLKIILNEKRIKADNVYPLVLRVTYNQTNTTISTGLKVNLAEWDKQTQLVKRSHPNFQLLSQRLRELFLKVQREVLKLQDTDNFNFENLKIALSEKPKAQPAILTFNAYAENLVNDLIAEGRVGNAIVYRTAINRLCTSHPFLQQSTQQLLFRMILKSMLKA